MRSHDLPDDCIHRLIITADITSGPDIEIVAAELVLDLVQRFGYQAIIPTGIPRHHHPRSPALNPLMPPIVAEGAYPRLAAVSTLGVAAMFIKGDGQQLSTASRYRSNLAPAASISSHSINIAPHPSTHSP